MPLVQLLLHIDIHWPLSQSSIAQHTFEWSPRSVPLIHLCTASLSHPPSAATCNPRYLKQYTSSNSLLFSITCIQPPLAYLEHLITLLLQTFTLNFLLSHTLPNSLTSLNNFSESATSAVSSPNNSWFISNLPPFALSSSSSFPSTPTSTSQTAPSIYTYIKGTVFAIIRSSHFFKLWLKIVMVSGTISEKISSLYDENCARGNTFEVHASSA